MVPSKILGDGGYAGPETIEALDGTTTVIAPVQRPRNPEIDPYAPKATDSPAVARWRKRMGTARAKRIHEERAATAECVSPQKRERGLIRSLVRGLEKVRAVALWHALAHDISRAMANGMLGAGGT